MRVFLTIVAACFFSHSLEAMVIVIDSGHGGRDAGATYTQAQKTYREKDIVLLYAQDLKRELKKHGHVVYTTRNRDHTTSLERRGDISRIVGADLFISLHLNSFAAAEVSGHEILANDLGKKYAQKIQKALIKKLKIKGRPVITTRHHELAVLKLEIPSLILEIGFLDSSEDRQKILASQFREGYARVLAQTLSGS